MIRSRLLALAAPLALTACGTPMPHPKVDPAPPAVHVVTSDRVVTAPCLTRGQIAPPPGKVGAQTNGNLQHDADVYAAALADAEAWIAKAWSVLPGCGD